MIPISQGRAGGASKIASNYHRPEIRVNMARSGIDGTITAFAGLYRDEVLAHRTRRVRLLGRKCRPKLMKTFLGYELLLGRRRITCPDLVTARYLRIFGELGCAVIEIPYDPTRTDRLLPQMEELFEWIRREGEKLPPAASRRIFRKVRLRLRESEARALHSTME
jgi:hypothetical protein